MQQATIQPEKIQIGKRGAVFELLYGMSVEEVRLSAAIADSKPIPWRCRIRHDPFVIGLPYYDNSDAFTTVMTALANRNTSSLTKCKRCGRVEVVGRP